MTLQKIQRQAAEQAAAQMRAAGLNPVIMPNNTVVDRSYVDRPSVTPSPGTVVDPALEPPPMPLAPDVAPLLYPSSISAPAPISAPPTITQGTSNQDYGETKNDDSGGEVRMAREDGGGDGGKAKRQGYYREPWDNVARRNRRKKTPVKKASKGKRKK